MFTKFMTSGCSKNDSLKKVLNARNSVTTQTGSANSDAASGAIAAESAAGSGRGRVRFYLAGGNKNCSAGLTRAAHAASL